MTSIPPFAAYKSLIKKLFINSDKLTVGYFMGVNIDLSKLA